MTISQLEEDIATKGKAVQRREELARPKGYLALKKQYILKLHSTYPY
jgi:hypothetical protein